MNRQFLEDFIKIYESEPCLWQTKCKEYHDRNKKDAGYVRLTEKLKEIELNSTKDAVIKKINNVRSSYRKEHKKLKESLKSGMSADDVYKPKLWYFGMLSFLGDENTPRSTRSNLESDNDEDAVENDNIETREHSDKSLQNSNETQSTSTYDEIASEPLAGSSAPTPRSQPRRKGRVQTSEQQLLENEVLQSIKDHFKKPRLEEDRFDIIGKAIALKLRGLPKQQMLIAEKIVNDTLFQAEMGQLTMTHKLVMEAAPLQNQRQFGRYYRPDVNPQPQQVCPGPESPMSYSSSPKPQLGRIHDNKQVQFYQSSGINNNLSEDNQTASFYSNFGENI